MTSKGKREEIFVALLLQPETKERPCRPVLFLDSKSNSRSLQRVSLVRWILKLKINMTSQVMAQILKGRVTWRIFCTRLDSLDPGSHKRYLDLCAK